MPQIFQVLRCYKCLSFQVHQVKKSNKWECKLCGEKQSIKRNYGVGTGKECRLHVQKFNELRGERTELDLNNVDSGEEFESSEENTIYSLVNNKATSKKASKWSNYVEKAEPNSTSDAENETLFGKEVVLEVPKKRKKFNKNYRNRKTKYKNDLSEDEYCEDDTPCPNVAGNDNGNNDYINQSCKKQIKKFIPPTNKSTSKWAEYSNNSEYNSHTVHRSDVSNLKKPESEMFACNEYRENTFNSISKIRTSNRNVICLEDDNRNPYDKSEISHVNGSTNNKNNCLLEFNRNVNQKPIVTTIKQNSKWSEFVDNADADVAPAIDSDEVIETTPYDDANTKPTNMFSLCNDNDLDSVLDI